MKIKTIEMNYLKNKFTTLTFLVFVVMLLFFSSLFPFAVKSIIFSSVICFVNVLIGITLIEHSIKKSHNQFMLVVFGSLGARLIAMLISVFVAIAVFNFPKLEFILFLFGFYLTFLALEIYYIQSKFKK